MSGTTTLSTTGTTSYLLPTGYLSTSGSQIVDTNGNNVRIASVGWNQNFTNITASVAQIVAAGFNTIRLSWVDATLPSDLARIQQVVAAATTNGLKVIIDHHTDEAGTPADGYGSQQSNGLWFDVGLGTNGTNGVGIQGTVTAAQFQADWVNVAKTFGGNSTVIGFDVDNEPTSSGSINWGQGGPTDIQAMYTTVGNAIQAVDPGALIIAEGPQEYSPPSSSSGMNPTVAAPEGDLTGVAAKPVLLNIPNKVVYSVHEYPSTIAGTSFDSGSALVQRLNGAWGNLVTNNIAPVWIGEMGGSLDSTADSSGSGLADEQAWATTLLDYMNGKYGSQGGPTFTASQQGVSGDWWDWGYNPGQYPDGVLNANGSYNAGQMAMWSQMLQKAILSNGGPGPTLNAPPSSDNTVVTDIKAAIMDASGNKWTITSGGQVAINGATDATTANVIELAYVKGTIWQENSNHLWWGETQPNASWSPAVGTATSPLPAIPVPSANNAVVIAPSVAAITDAGGNKWTITSGGQVAVNGAVDSTTSNVNELAYVNGAIWQENRNNLWWSKTQPSASWGPSAGTATSPLPATPVASANDMIVNAGSTASIIDSSSNTWTITGTKQIAVNGVTDSTTANVKELAYVDGKIWQENAGNLWWGKTSPTDAWSPNAGTPTSPLPTSISIAPSQTNATVSLSNVLVVANSGNHMVFITGNGDTVKLSGGTDTISDSGSSNIYVIPAAGKGYDSFTTNVLTTTGDKLDLQTALAATDWAGASSTLSKYLKVVNSTQGVVLSIASTSGGPAAAIATISGATTINLTSLLTHALT